MTQEWTNPANCCNQNYGFDKPQMWTIARAGAYNGARTPGYHNKVKTGALLPLNSYFRTDGLCRRVPGNLVTGRMYSCGGCDPYEFVNTRMNGVVAPTKLLNGADAFVRPTGLPDPYSTVDTNALLVAAMADSLPDFDALTALVESKQTIEMIVKARSDAKRLIKNALKGGKRTAKAACDAWLSWRYGWQTLGYDIQNAAELLRRPLTDYYIHGRAGSSSTDGEVTSVPWNNGWELGVDNTEWSQDLSVRAVMVGSLSLRTLNAVADVPITIWEEIPFSFVADWFVNVGDVLAAWKVRRSLSNCYTSIGYKETIQSRVERFITGNSPGNNYTRVSGKAVTYETLITRARIPAGYPTLVPSITVKLTSKRILDAAALLAKRIL